MTIQLAAARPVMKLLVGCDTMARYRRTAANDNASAVLDRSEVRDALRHFAEHGLGAAENARQTAERAYFAGDHDGYRHWLAICRTLDRRLAMTLRDSVQQRQPSS